MGQYALANHVFACLDGEHIVLLDLKQDRYLALEAEKAAGLAAMVPGWPVKQEAAPAEPKSSGATADRLAQSLVSRGLLAAQPGNGKSAAQVRIPRPSKALVFDDYEDPPPLRLPTVFAFVIAAATAALAVGRWRFERLVRRVERRNRSGRELLDVERARALVATFVQLRPFLFTARDACLFETFTLMEFLSWHGIHARWVFGVQARPFAAHCWVQYEDSVLNDTVERVRIYTPIMSV